MGQSDAYGISCEKLFLALFRSFMFKTIPPTFYPSMKETDCYVLTLWTRKKKTFMLQLVCWPCQIF